ncbi:5,6-dimethylbenzimidazole synthase [Carnimonas nigrificans]|uniref:5,6-dimethylbenzimidazole synthase n=1 Tax=Carnimonas nigrificans TaxID=64323 RepID=UPI00068620A2|nr:5,6-dimethylbenzimidazole synthase [Carnimonas nigrificans]
MPMEWAFPADQKEGVYRAIYERRDVRHFKAGAIAEEVLNRIIDAGLAAPSVGYMQPWRFVRIQQASLREEIFQLAEHERQQTAAALGERKEEFLRLKTDGIRECAEVIVVLLCDHRERYIFGRRSMPHMDLASASCAIQNMWLAARAEGIGLGWVSLFDPDELRALLKAPNGAEPIAILCLGHVERFDERPLLETAGWDSHRERADVLMTDQWITPTAGYSDKDSL